MSTPNTGSRSDLDTLTTAELVQDVAYATRMSRHDAEATVNAVLETIRASLASGIRVELLGFGTFGVRRRGFRIGPYSEAGAKAMVVARRVPYFKPGGELTNRVDSQVGRSRDSTSEAGSPKRRPGGNLLRAARRMTSARASMPGRIHGPLGDLADELGGDAFRRTSVGLTWPPP